VEEIESLFTRPVILLPDILHSIHEERLRAIGKTDQGRHVFLVLTIRKRGRRSFIRPISARYMHRQEVKQYEEDNPELSHGPGS
jgi:uncharacterized protein